MKILLQYLRPHRGLVTLVLFLAAINIGFSLIDPIIFGGLVNLATEHHGPLKTPPGQFDWDRSFNSFSWKQPGVFFLLTASITVAMISRIAKNFQDYFMNLVVQKFGAKVFTDGLRHAMKLPYQEFEDQRSGETLSVLQKVRTDTERFINNFVNILFTVLVGIVIVAVYATSIRFTTRDGHTLIQIINNLGQVIRTLEDRDYTTAGTYTVTFDSFALPSGVYYARLQNGPIQQVATMLKVR